MNEMDVRALFRLAHQQLDSLPLQESTWDKPVLEKELWALDRYERRAFSRRKSAIRAFEEARATEAATGHELRGQTNSAGVE
jgi:hypothetical protein